MDLSAIRARTTSGRAARREIQIFGTVMTGELFNLLKEHSILADLLQGPVEPNEAFKRGYSRALQREMLPADLFGVRAAVLLGQARKDDAPSFTSGLLIGTDVRIGLPAASARSRSHGPAGADAALCRRASPRPAASRSSWTGNTASSRAFGRLRR